MKLPKIGLALGSGGAKGLAHIGVLQTLQKANVPIDIICGTSMGAVIGSFFAAGDDVDMLASLAKELNNSHLIDVTIPRWGLIKGRKAHALVRLMTQNKSFAELDKTFGVVATDLNTGERVVFTEGNVADAVRASISIPGVVVPYSCNNRLLVDGAVVESVPAKLAKEMGADIIIAVDLDFDSNEKKNTINNIYDVIMQSIEILERQARINYYTYADVIIKPQIGSYSWTNFEAAADLIELGKKACAGFLPEIEEKIREWKSEIVK